MIACPCRVCIAVINAVVELESDNVYGLELNNGSRVLALPGSDNSIRGLTVDGWRSAGVGWPLPTEPRRKGNY